ncbi:MAG: hypothetical protein PHY46_01560 [Candidatus Omnitrophica bacterium]|nr:hypothetical protein [Candidatus Omnitrophota bacterium]MDD5356113.1 hypothetical protein [Candidatus Omnitrophota bacterium]
MIKNQNAQALIAAIAIMLVLALFSVVAMSLIGMQTSQTATGLSESTQAFYLAHAGLEWYMQQLAEDDDWSDEVAPAAQSLGSGTFEISLSNQSTDSIDVKSTGKILGPDARNRERWMSATIKREALVDYAVFWHQDGPGAQLTFSNSGSGTDVVGDMWSIGSANIGSNSSITGGKIYYAQGETVTGSGSYTAQVVPPPFPQIPSLDTTYYDDLMTDWNARIDAADSNISSGSGDLTLSSDVDWTGQNISRRDIDTNGFDITGTNFTVTCRSFNLENNSEIDSNASNFTINCNRDFNMTGNSQINADDYRINCSRNFLMSGTSNINSSDFELYLDDDFDSNGTVSITGYGYIVCSDIGQINLHDATTDSGTFTATPSGGSIYFLSGTDMTVNSTQNDTGVILNSGCFLYSRNPSGTTDTLTIRNEDTTIDGATIIAERRIIVEDGADITDSVLYVGYASSNSNNELSITDSSTTVTGTVISRGRNVPSLRINNSASVTGLVYQYDGVGTLGRAEVDGGSTITGALLVRQFDGNSFGPATVTYDEDSLPSPLPEGFQSSGVEIESGSWDGL